MFEEHRASHYTASWIRWAGGCCMIWMGTFTGCQEDRKDYRKIIENLLVIYVSIFGISKQCRRSMYLSWLPTLSPPAQNGPKRPLPAVEAETMRRIVDTGLNAVRLPLGHWVLQEPAQGEAFQGPCLDPRIPQAKSGNVLSAHPGTMTCRF